MREKEFIFVQKDADMTRPQLVILTDTAVKIQKRDSNAISTLFQNVFQSLLNLAPKELQETCSTEYFQTKRVKNFRLEKFLPG